MKTKTVMRIFDSREKLRKKAPAILKLLETKFSLLEAHASVKELNESHGTNARMISPQTADQLLTDGTENWMFFDDCSPFVTDAIIAYEKVGKRLEDEIVFIDDNGTRFVLPTGQYKGEKNVGLLASRLTADNFHEERNTIIINPDSRLLFSVPDIPKKAGWYMQHKSTIPHGKTVHPSKKSRYFFRFNNLCYVGPIVRGTRFGGLRHGIVGGYWPLNGFGMILEIPDNEIPKFEAITSDPPHKKTILVEIEGISEQELMELLNSTARIRARLRSTSSK